MHGSRIVVLALAVLIFAAGASLSADDFCQRKCDAWLAMCKKDCENAPVPAECLKNCTPGYQACLTACAE